MHSGDRRSHRRSFLQFACLPGKLFGQLRHRGKQSHRLTIPLRISCLAVSPLKDAFRTIQGSSNI
jgi:hypothetical protein